MTAQPNPARRDRILHEAQRLFFSQGLKGVSMDAVASAAGIKKANVFHYFPSKEALELAVLERFSSDLRERLAAQFAASAEDPIETVARMFEEAARGMRRRRCRGGCFAGNLAQESDHRESVRVQVAQLLGFWVAEVARLLQRARSSGYFRRELEPEPAAEAILSLFEGSLLFSKASRRPGAIENARDMAIAYLEAFRVARRRRKSAAHRPSGPILAYRA